MTPEQPAQQEKMVQMASCSYRSPARRARPPQRLQSAIRVRVRRSPAARRAGSASQGRATAARAFLDPARNMAFSRPAQPPRCDYNRQVSPVRHRRAIMQRVSSSLTLRARFTTAARAARPESGSASTNPRVQLGTTSAITGRKATASTTTRRQSRAQSKQPKRAVGES